MARNVRSVKLWRGFFVVVVGFVFLLKIVHMKRDILVVRMVMVD